MKGRPIRTGSFPQKASNGGSSEVRYTHRKVEEGRGTSFLCYAAGNGLGGDEIVGPTMGDECGNSTGLTEKLHWVLRGVNEGYS